MNTHDIPVPIFFFDYRKNGASIIKHGVSFEEAKGIWLDPDYLRVPARENGEKRFLAVGMVDGRCLAAIATNRGDAVRIISARRASAKEARLHGKHCR